MICRVRFSFVRGIYSGSFIDHDFDGSSTIADIKSYLIASKNACDPITSALLLVWEEQLQKLTDDGMIAANLGEKASITVSIIRKPSPSILAPSILAPSVLAPSILVDTSSNKSTIVGAATPDSTASSAACENPDAVSNCSSAAHRAHADGAGVAVTGSLPPASAQALILPVTSTSESASSSRDEPRASRALRDGARVRIEGLVTATHLNGRTGVIRGEFNSQTVRWTVEIDASATSPSSCGSFRCANLKLLRCFSTEWEDEDGEVWPKHVEFRVQCPKGHALALRDDCPAAAACEALPRGLIHGASCAAKQPLHEFQDLHSAANSRLLCRICRMICVRKSAEAASWRMCAVAADCCGSYAVCGSCACSPAARGQSPVTSDDFCSMVGEL
jgi:hypothetical protein